MIIARSADVGAGDGAAEGAGETVGANVSPSAVGARDDGAEVGPVLAGVVVVNLVARVLAGVLVLFSAAEE